MRAVIWHACYRQRKGVYNPEIYTYVLPVPWMDCVQANIPTCIQSNIMRNHTISQPPEEATSTYQHTQLLSANLHQPTNQPTQNQTHNKELSSLHPLLALLPVASHPKLYHRSRPYLRIPSYKPTTLITHLRPLNHAPLLLEGENSVDPTKNRHVASDCS